MAVEEKQLVGSHAEVWLGGNKIAILKKIIVNVTVNREEVQRGMDADSVMTGLKVEWNATLAKVNTMWLDFFEDYKKGIDRRVEIITKLADPNAKGGGQERYSIGNAWFDSLPLINYEVGTPIDDEVKGGSTASDLINLDRID